MPTRVTNWPPIVLLWLAGLRAMVSTRANRFEGA